MVTVAGRSAIIRTRSGSDGTGELVAYDPDVPEAPTHITHLNDDFLAESPSAPIERLSVEHEQFEIESSITKPVDFDPARPYPVIVFVHGGPHMFQTFGYVDMNQLFANAGYLVVSPNPRGSTSHGDAFTAGCLGDWGVATGATSSLHSTGRWNFPMRILRERGSMAIHTVAT